MARGMALLGQISRALAILGGGLLLLLTAMTVASVLGRALFALPVPGDLELMQMGLAVAIAWCLPWCQYRRHQIAVTALTDRAPRRLRQALEALALLTSAGVLGLLAWRQALGMADLHSYGDVSTVLGVPVWWAVAAILPGLGLSALLALGQVFTPLSPVPEDQP